jgi:hypothetical protein
MWEKENEETDKNNKKEKTRIKRREVNTTSVQPDKADDMVAPTHECKTLSLNLELQMYTEVTFMNL